jgi:hypothetical protein
VFLRDRDAPAHVDEEAIGAPAVAEAE